MTATAEIINLADYRKSRQPRDEKASAAMVSMMVSWVPVWVMVPVPMMPVMPLATFG